MSNCSQIFSDEALLQRVQEMGQSMSELRKLRRRVREAEARARALARKRQFSPPQKVLIAARVAANDRF
jgi:ethanolamine utilization cobalamin adenosyltransferase